MDTSENKLKVLLVGTKRTCDKASTFDCGDNILISFPVLDTRKCKRVEFLKDEYEWLILTSPAAALHFSQLANKPIFEKVAVVGPSTKKAAENAGLSVNYLPDHYNALNFSQDFLKIFPNTQSALFPCSAKADATIPGSFKAAGIHLDRVNLYEPIKLEKKKLPEYDAAVFFSSSSVEAFKENYGIPSTQKIAAIGVKAAKSIIKSFGIEPRIPTKSTTIDTIQTLL